MKKSNVLVLKDFKVPEGPGAHYCLFCLSGSGKGESYFLLGERVILGRSEKADLVIQDSKISREHAVIEHLVDGFVIRDLQSQNGVFVNGQKIREHFLKEGDKIIVGKNIYRFGVVETNDNPVLKIKKKQKASATFEKPKKMNPKILLLIGVLVVIFLFFGEDKSDKNGAKKTAIEQKVDTGMDGYATLLKKKQLEDDKELGKKVDVILQRGLRESREANYFRAINEFNSALNLSPSNVRASFYLSKTKQALDKYIEDKFIMAKKAIEALKYKDASVDYCSIVRLLKDYVDDQRYKDAQANLRDLENLMGLNNGEIKCF